MSEIQRAKKWADFARQFAGIKAGSLRTGVPARISIDGQSVTVDAKLLRDGLKGMWKSDQVKACLDDDGVVFETYEAVKGSQLGLYTPRKVGSFRLPLVDPACPRYEFSQILDIDFSPKLVAIDEKRDRAWLKKAVAKKSGPQYFYGQAGHVHGNIAANGYSLHHVPSLASECKEAGCGKYDDTSFPPELIEALERARDISNLPETCKVIVKTRQLATIVKAAIATTRGVSSPSMQLSVNGALTMRAEGEGVDTTFVAKDGDRLGYHKSKGFPDDLFSMLHEGQDGETTVNPVFMRDALAGMGPETLVAIGDKAVYITDGRNEAVIMPMETNQR